MDFDHVVGIFQSTLSVRRAAVSDPALQRAGEISIHALREESGVDGFVAVGVGHDISIHALREESGALDALAGHGDLISIHALREESGWRRTRRVPQGRNFNPRSP